MLAATHTQFGPAHVLRTQEVEKPTVGRNEVLVRVHASPVTEGDRRLRAADFPGFTGIFGRLMFGLFRPRNPVPGTMFAGRVVAVGKDVSRFQVGDDVFGSCGHGAQAEFLAVDEGAPLAKIPVGIGYDDAAAVPYGAVTALAFLRDVARVEPGDRVLIIGASGGVGRFAVQIARHLGAHVTGVASGRNAAMVERLGANEVIDYTRVDYTDNGETYDVIFDTVRGDGFRGARGSLSDGGRYVTLYVSLLILWQALRSAIFGGPKPRASVVVGSQSLTADVAELMAQGVVTPVIAARYPLARVADAHAEQESGRPAGAVIVSVNAAERGPAPVRTLKVA